MRRVRHAPPPRERVRAALEVLLGGDEDYASFAQLAAHLRAEGHAPSADALRRAVEAVADEEAGLAIQGDAVVLI